MIYIKAAWLMETIVFSEGLSIILTNNVHLGVSKPSIVHNSTNSIHSEGSDDTRESSTNVKLLDTGHYASQTFRLLCCSPPTRDKSIFLAS